ncbi:MAG: hypothetical protein ACXWNK_08135, partial [Vulcanimicrobiaceae bacterium]
MIAASTVDVCARCRVPTLRAAVEHARPGATIIIHDAQAGGVIVRVPLTIAGTGRAAEILGGSAATGIDIRADGVK